MHYIYMGIMIGIGLMLAPIILVAVIRVIPIVLGLAFVGLLIWGVVAFGMAVIPEIVKDPIGSLQLAGGLLAFVAVGLLPWGFFELYNRYKDRKA